MDNMVGQRIKDRRRELNITQTQIQRETSVSSGNLSCIENGKYLPSAIALIELSKMLNCSIDWILTGKSPISDIPNAFDIRESELLNGFRELSEEDKEELMEILKVKLRKAHKGKERNPKSSGLTDTEEGDMVG